MAIALDTITIDTLDPKPLAEWWGRHLNGEVTVHSDGFVQVALGGLTLFFVAVPDPTPGKNKFHFDLTATDREAAKSDMVADGATFIREQTQDGFTWTTLADPDGNLFDLTQADGK